MGLSRYYFDHQLTILRYILHFSQTDNEAFYKTCDTVFFDLKTEKEKVMMALKMMPL